MIGRLGRSLGWNYDLQDWKWWWWWGLHKGFSTCPFPVSGLSGEIPRKLQIYTWEWRGVSIIDTHTRILASLLVRGSSWIPG